MCQRNAVTEKPDTPVVGKMEFSPLTEKERLHEIDMRVGQRLMEREMRRSEYLRGFFDCFYVLAMIALMAYFGFFYKVED